MKKIVREFTAFLFFLSFSFPFIFPQLVDIVSFFCSNMEHHTSMIPIINVFSENFVSIRKFLLSRLNIVQFQTWYTINFPIEMLRVLYGNVSDLMLFKNSVQLALGMKLACLIRRHSLTSILFHFCFGGETMPLVTSQEMAMDSSWKLSYYTHAYTISV